MITLKNFHLTLALIAISLLNSQAQINDVSSIGKEIPEEVALQLVKSFNAKFPTEVKGHIYGEKILFQFLTATDVAGLYIYNGLDNEGNSKLVFASADASSCCPEPTSIPSTIGDRGKPCPPYCLSDSSGISQSPNLGKIDLIKVGAPITESFANELINNFKTKYPERPLVQLFGRTLIQNILNQENVEGIYISYALDEAGQEKFLLVGATKTKVLWDGIIADGIIYSPQSEIQAKVFRK